MMAKTAAVRLCCILSMLCAVDTGVMSFTNCDGLICPEGSSCQVSTTSVNGHQQTVKTCTDSEGNVKARSITSDHSSRRNSIQSSSFVTSGGGRGCTQQTSTVNGKTTTTYSCSDPEDIQKVKQVGEEMQRRMTEVQQRMAGMMTEMNQGIQNRVMENMQIMRQNLG
ncbi:uncharacterized protein LOC134540248 [Bacillus rossius redtenbacheri]|uniref:uncharacterized protein LOC134540248 n=1 Tax=Bacillus rossius redtenbacheri TaxID=93214 RepID=UPI002FDECF9E